MMAFGPVPTNELLNQLTADSSEAVRAQVTHIIGVLGTQQAAEQLQHLLADPSSVVRREACESCLRQNILPKLESLLPLLKSQDQTEALLARNLLASLPLHQWETQLLNHPDNRLFIQGAAALMTSEPTLERGLSGSGSSQ